MDTPIEGGCMCGAIRFELSEDPLAFVACHCRECQYVSGGAPAFSVQVKRSAITVLKGTPRVFESDSETGNKVFRSFCADCGTPLFAGSERRPEFQALKAGALDDSNGLTLQAHFWTTSAPDWAHIDHDIPKFETNRV